MYYSLKLTVCSSVFSFVSEAQRSIVLAQAGAHRQMDFSLQH